LWVWVGTRANSPAPGQGMVEEVVAAPVQEIVTSD